ncbi:hypothetical protein [Neobacillus drentensis]|uniref:hypothetical protein n=1 Tax=Neobacillus drentensis TaxID=220684 RepID=UPI003001477A
MSLGVFFILAVLKAIVDFLAKLIGAEGAKTPAGGRGRGDPTGASAEEAVSTREPHAPGAEINSQVNRAIIFGKQKKTGHLDLS